MTALHTEYSQRAGDNTFILGTLGWSEGREGEGYNPNAESENEAGGFHAQLGKSSSTGRVPLLGEASACWWLCQGLKCPQRLLPWPGPRVLAGAPGSGSWRRRHGERANAPLPHLRASSKHKNPRQASYGPLGDMSRSRLLLLSCDNFLLREEQVNTFTFILFH